MEWAVIIAPVGLVLMGFVGGYRAWFRPLVADRFGEDGSRRSRKPGASRRRSFERHCLRALGCLMAASFLGGMDGISLPYFPALRAGAAAVFILVEALLAYCAYWRWQRPFAD